MRLVRDAVSGVKWSAVSRYGEHAAALLTTIILARLLSPDAFGLLGMATIVTGFLLVVGDLGLGTVLIQRDTISRELQSSVFWTNIGVGLLMAALLLVAAPAIGLLFREENVVPVVRVLGLGLVLSGLGAVPTALLTRELAFQRLARVQLSAVATGGMVGIGMAAAGLGVWSLVGQHLARLLVENCTVLFVSGFRPELRIRSSELRSVASFGLSLSGSRIASYTLRNIDNLLIGRFLGASALGLYDIAWRLIEYPKNALSVVIGRVMLPTYARMHDDDERLARTFVQVGAAIALVSSPALIGMMLVAGPLVLLLLGAQWAPAAILVVLLAPVGLAQSIGSTTGSVYIAKNRTGWLFIWSLFALVIVTSGVTVGLAWGIAGVAIGRLVTNTVLSPINLAIALRMVGLRLRELGRSLWPIAQATFAMAIAVGAVRLLLEVTVSGAAFSLLVTAVLTGIVAYMWMLRWTRPPILQEISTVLSLTGGNRLRQLLGRLRLVPERAP